MIEVGVLRRRMRQRRVLSGIELLRVRGLGIWVLCSLGEVEVETL